MDDSFLFLASEFQEDMGIGWNGMEISWLGGMGIRQ